MNLNATATVQPYGTINKEKVMRAIIKDNKYGSALYVDKVEDAGKNRFLVSVSYSSQPVHGHRDTATMVSRQLSKNNVAHTLENSSEKTAIGDALNGQYGVWTHNITVYIHDPDSINLDEENLMQSLKNLLNENKILELMHKKFYAEYGRDPRSARELLNFAKKKNGKETAAKKAVEKHEKEMHEGIVGQVFKAISAPIRRRRAESYYAKKSDKIWNDQKTKPNKDADVDVKLGRLHKKARDVQGPIRKFIQDYKLAKADRDYYKSLYDK